MSKFCANGHQMEDSWETCPYCQRSGYPAGPPAVTVKTRIEAEPRGSGSPGAGRRSVTVAEKQKPPVVGWFVVLSGPQKGEDFRIREGPNTIGSASDADIVLHDTAISGKHASLRYKDQKFTITDLDSTNGTFLNDRGDPIAREELKDNDIIRLGEVVLKFKSL
jgi:hypothetical protein